MDFVGQGTRLAPGDIGELARSVGLETAVLLTFIEIEAAGVGFDVKKRPKVLPEPHRFYAELGAADKRAQAVREGLAYKTWGTKPYPKTFDARYEQIRRGMMISENAALRACSWGLGQVLGSNCKSAGHATALEMVRSAMVSERNQLEHMVNFLVNEGLIPMLKGKDFTKKESWIPAVSRYNGSGYAKHNYHGRMATAYVKHSMRGGDVLTDRAVILYPGSRGELVMNLQRDLQGAGWLKGSAPDGRYGPATESAVRAIQASLGVSQDGRYGPLTAAAFEKSLKTVEVDLSPAPPVWDGQQPASARELIEEFAAQQRRALDELLAALGKE